MRVLSPPRGRSGAAGAGGVPGIIGWVTDHRRATPPGEPATDRPARLRALAAALPSLRCPVCQAGLALAGASVRCRRGHSYDVARQGYVNLVSGQPPGTADTPAMVAARDRFLRGGPYAPVAAALAAAAARFDPVLSPGVVVDLAGGIGYYLAAVLDSVAGRVGICLDLSKAQLRRAARAHPRAAAVGADVWQELPLTDRCAGVALSVFGPRNPAELARVLVPQGVLLLVTPTVHHLHELVAPLGMLTVDAAKPQRLAAKLQGLRLVSDQTLSYQLRLRHDQVADLVTMGPSAHHITGSELAARVGALPEPVTATVSARLAAYRPGR
jgi:23S rRNA (guanine745-N1)-methyltransferase